MSFKCACVCVCMYVFGREGYDKDVKAASSVQTVHFYSFRRGWFVMWTDAQPVEYIQYIYNARIIPFDF